VAGCCQHGDEPSVSKRKLGKFLTSRTAISFSRKTLLHEVIYVVIHVRTECKHCVMRWESANKNDRLGNAFTILYNITSSH
jgi:hypothetical protein